VRQASTAANNQVPITPSTKNDTPIGNDGHLKKNWQRLQSEQLPLKSVRYRPPPSPGTKNERNVAINGRSLAAN
jgi:hypothetical protein